MKLTTFAALLTTCLNLLSSDALANDTLNKCIDSNGGVTYSNLPCRDALETHKLVIDPPPRPAPVRTPPKAEASHPPPAAPASNESKRETRHKSDQSSARARASKCDTIADKLGRVIDKMDAARRQGHTQKQMDDWNQQIRDFERQKQQSGCF